MSRKDITKLRKEVLLRLQIGSASLDPIVGPVLEKARRAGISLHNTGKLMHLAYEEGAKDSLSMLRGFCKEGDSRT